MSYLALYRKYRPDTFEGVIGQDNIVTTLINQIKTGHIGHAYLFTGTRGTGKTSTAKIFAKAINCLHPVNGSPCGECEVCRALADQSNIDIIEIDAASNNGVNEIRDLREKVQYPPVSCKYKVYIIDEVHMLTGPAFNALLKTLEEPPRHAIFILATTEVHKIPATILSRCMRFDFRLVPTEKIAAHIENIFKEQGKEYDKEAVYAIANAGEGSIRDALSVADITLSFKEGKLTYDDVTDVLGSVKTGVLTDFVKNLLCGKQGEVLDAIEELCFSGKSISVLIKDVCAMLRNLIVIKTCKRPNDILKLPEENYKNLKVIAEEITEDRIVRCLEIYSETESFLRYSAHPRIIFETATVKACRPDTDYNFDALLARISELEKELATLKEQGIKISRTEESDATLNNGVSQNNSAEDSEKQTKNAEEVAKIDTEKADSKELAAEDEKNSETKPLLKISAFGSDEVKGKLLFNLRAAGNEMLWNLFQTVSLNVGEGNIILHVKKEADKDILENEQSLSQIKEALKEFEDFGIVVKLVAEERRKDAVDNSSDRIKSIFGDDIIILDK